MMSFLGDVDEASRQVPGVGGTQRRVDEGPLRAPGVAMKYSSIVEAFTEVRS